MNEKSEKLRDACELAAQTFRKLDANEHLEIILKLEYCIGSYNFDKNPSGLYDFGYQALNMLKDIKQKNTRKVNKNVISSLEQALAG
jgi:hypothetical protein